MYWIRSERWDFEPYEQQEHDQHDAETADMDAAFTAEERARLEALRSRLQALSADVELDVSDRHLRFARWLVQHGRLDEGF